MSSAPISPFQQGSKAWAGLCPSTYFGGQSRPMLDICSGPTQKQNANVGWGWQHDGQEQTQAMQCQTWSTFATIQGYTLQMGQDGERKGRRCPSNSRMLIRMAAWTVRFGSRESEPGSVAPLFAVSALLKFRIVTLLPPISPSSSLQTIRVVTTSSSR